MKIHPLGAKFPADGRTHKKLTVAFQNLAHVPKTVIRVFG